MNGTEQALTFDCEGSRLVGILSVPQRPDEVGVVIIVGGPQYRAGSHRQFVQLARALASAGHAVLRFDYRGMGDSEAERRGFEQVSRDVAAAIDALQGAMPEVRRVVLWGLCDGAAAALIYLDDAGDPRVAGLALINPWVRDAASLAKTHVKHYYCSRLKDPEFWRKLASGRVALGAIVGLVRSLRASFGRVGGDDAAAFQQRMARAWARFTGPRLLILSEHDYTAREFVEYAAASASWRRAVKTRPAARIQIPGADHTCSSPSAQRAMETATCDWMQAALGAPAGAP